MSHSHLLRKYWCAQEHPSFYALTTLSPSISLYKQSHTHAIKKDCDSKDDPIFLQTHFHSVKWPTPRVLSSLIMMALTRIRIFYPRRCKTSLVGQSAGMRMKWQVCISVLCVCFLVSVLIIELSKVVWHVNLSLCVSAVQFNFFFNDLPPHSQRAKYSRNAHRWCCFVIGMVVYISFTFQFIFIYSLRSPSSTGLQNLPSK